MSFRFLARWNETRFMPEKSISINRTLVGIIAAVCLGAAGMIALVDSHENVWCAAFIRVGLVTGAFWLALPSRHREAAWAHVSPHTLLLVLLAALVFVKRPLVFLPLLAVLTIIGLLLRPRGGRRPRPPREKQRR
jgi:hypothetical protein